MITLGIETSCDETSVSGLKGRRLVLSNVVVSSLGEHRPFGGVVPEIASRSQTEAILGCLDAALKKAKIPLSRVDLIAVTQGPGLMGSLLVGLSAAKALSLALRKPLIGVDHVIAHAYAGFLSDNSLRFPCLGLVVSGGHTLLLRMDSPSRIRVLGRTLDDAAGEAFDKVAKILGLGYPGGPEIDRLSQGQDSDRFFFTRPFLKSSFDFSFSGIKTAVFYAVQKIKNKKPLTLKTKREICAGFQEAVCEALVAKSVRAAKAEQLLSVVVGGGVSANTRLRRMFRSLSRKESLNVVFPSPSLCQDNAAMIAGLGAALYLEGARGGLGIASYADFNLGRNRKNGGANDARQKK